MSERTQDWRQFVARTILRPFAVGDLIDRHTRLLVSRIGNGRTWHDHKNDRWSGRWGIPSSLYAELGWRQYYFVDMAIRACHFGAAASADWLFVSLLPPVESSPILALARADTLEFVGDYASAAECLQAVLPNAEKLRPGLPDAAYRLMKIAWASCHATAFGDWKLALREARSLRTWMVDIELEDYTDVMVCFFFNHDLSHGLVLIRNRVVTHSRSAASGCITI